jgi:hypothetical protein
MTIFTATITSTRIDHYYRYVAAALATHSPFPLGHMLIVYEVIIKSHSRDTHVIGAAISCLWAYDAESTAAIMPTWHRRRTCHAITESLLNSRKPLPQGSPLFSRSPCSSDHLVLFSSDAKAKPRIMATLPCWMRLSKLDREIKFISAQIWSLSITDNNSHLGSSEQVLFLLIQPRPSHGHRVEQAWQDDQCQ